VIIVVLTLATLHLPMAFTAVFALIDVALLLILIGTAQGSSVPVPEPAAPGGPGRGCCSQPDRERERAGRPRLRQVNVRGSPSLSRGFDQSHNMA